MNPNVEQLYLKGKMPKRKQNKNKIDSYGFAYSIQKLWALGIPIYFKSKPKNYIILVIALSLQLFGKYLQQVEL